MYLDEKQDFEPVPAGAHDALISAFVDIGRQGTPWGEKHQCVLECELLDEHLPNGKRAHISRIFTLSLYSSAALRIALDDAKLTPPLVTVDGRRTRQIGSIVGRPCVVVVKHEEGNNGKTYARIAQLLPAKRDGELSLDPLVFDINADMDRFDELPVWLKNKVAGSVEYKQRMQRNAPDPAYEAEYGTPPARPAELFETDDERIPF